MILIMLIAILAGTLVLAVILTALLCWVLATPAFCGGTVVLMWLILLRRADRRKRPTRLAAKVWAHRITPTMQPETWGRRRLPRPFRQSGVLPTGD